MDESANVLPDVTGVESAISLPAELGPGVTVGMAAYGNADLTAATLRTLLASATGDFELLLVDDCSPDDGATLRAFEAVRARHPRCRVFRFARNLEYTGSLNAILSHASGDLVLFLSNDIFVTPAYLRRLLAVASLDPCHGVVRGTSNFVDNASTRHNVSLGARRSIGEVMEFADEREVRLGDDAFEDAFLTGDAFLVRRSVIERIGTFDPFFFGYFGDHDFGLRAQIAGFKLLLASGAFAYHHQSANFDYLPAPLRQQKLMRRWTRVIENWARFKIKYGLPVDLAYTSVNEVDWRALGRQEFDPARHYCAPGDYREHEQ